MNRIEYIDYLKGLCIISVVMLHVLYINQGQNTVLIKILDIFQMPIFFFLSGLFAFKKDIYNTQTIMSLIKTKTITLLLPFIFVGSIYTIISKTSILDNFLFSNMHNGYWFIWVLFMMFLILSIVQIINYILNPQKKIIIHIGIFILIYLGIIFIYTFFSQTLFYHFFSIPQIFRYIIFFFFGILYSKYEQVRILFSNQYTQFLSIILAILLGIIYYNTHIIFTQLLSRLFSVIALFNIIKQNKESLILNKYISYIGKKSLSIYILHYFLIFDLPFGWLINIYSNISCTFFVVCILSIAITITTLLLDLLISSSSILSFLFIGKNK